MRLYLDLEFSHALSPDGPVPSIGGFEVRLTDGTCIQFDFLNTAYTIDDKNPKLLHVKCSVGDYNSFGNMHTLHERAMDICDITECYVDLDEFQHVNPDIHPIRLHHFVLECKPTTHIRCVDNQNIIATLYSDSVCQYAMTDVVINRYNTMLKNQNM